MPKDPPSHLNIAFRADASHDIGVGHLMRCLTLADAMKSRAARTRFVCRHIPEHLRTLVISHGHELRLMPASASAELLDELPQARLLGTSQRRDAADALALLSDVKWNWIVVDHYGIDARWESVVREIANKIMVIDDTADRKHDCDLLLDQNLYSNMDARYVGKVPAACKLLLGPRFALLREEFRQLRATTKPRSGPVKRVLVFFGGVDADNCTAIAIQALAIQNRKDLHVDVVIGSQHPQKNQVASACATHGFHCHVQTARMAELMAAADLGIGAGGSASWERCCLGLPSIVLSLADNQTEIAEALDHFQACRYVGPRSAASADALQGAILELLRSKDRIQMMSAKAYSLVDGLGVDRLCETLVC